MISLKEAVSPLSCTQHMIKEYLLNKQRKESGFTFFVVGRKNKAQSGDGFGPKYQLKWSTALSVCYFCQCGMRTRWGVSLLSSTIQSVSLAFLPLPHRGQDTLSGGLPGSSVSVQRGAEQRTGGSWRRTSRARVRFLLFLFPLCLLFFASPMMLFMECQFLFLIKGRKNPVLYKNKSDDSAGLLSAKWLPVITSLTAFLTEAGFWTQGETAAPEAHLSKWLTRKAAQVVWRVGSHELWPGEPQLTKSCWSVSTERGTNLAEIMEFLLTSFRYSK